MVISVKSSPPDPVVRLDTGLEMLCEGASSPATERALATVVATAGSTYRKPGARMLIMGDGTYLGLLSGGCLESDMKLHARSVLESGLARAIEYDMRGPDDILFGLGAGCEGAMRVLLEPANPGDGAAAALIAAERMTAAGQSTCLVCVHESSDFPLGTYSTASEARPLPAALAAAARSAFEQQSSRAAVIDAEGGRTRAFIQFLAPPPHLLICGAGPDAQPVAAAARALKWRVTVVDHRPAYAQASRFPGTRVALANPGALADTVDLGGCHAVVVMSHHLASDVSYLRVLATASGPAFLGVLGPSARRRRLLDELGTAAEGLRTRLIGPVGLEIGACTPEGIALAIVSQIHAALGVPRVAQPQHSLADPETSRA